MTNSRIVVSVIIFLCCLVVLMGCENAGKGKALAITSQGEKQLIASTVASPDDIKPETSANEREEPQEDKVVVMVNGSNIMRSHIGERIAPLVMLSEIGQKPTDQFKNYLRQEALNEILKQQLVKEAMESWGIEVTDKQITKILAEIADRRNMTVGDFLEQASKHGTARTHVEKQIREDISLDKLIELEVDNDRLVVTAEEVQKYYDENKNITTSDKDRLAIIKWLARKKKRAVVDDYLNSLVSRAEMVWVQNQ